MNRNNKITILITILLLSIQFNYAQKETAEVKVIARAQEDRILLRWALNTSFAWKKGNQYGYTLERYTISRDQKTLLKPEKIIIKQDFKPLPMLDWEGLVQTNDQAAVMAQALYGESFVVESGGGMASIVNISEEQEQRFGFALLAADQNFEVAQNAGLGYIDTHIKSNEKYLYKVISNIPASELETKEGGALIGVEDYEPLPKPADFVGVFQDGSALLSWNFSMLRNTYSGYDIERSEDGVSFQQLNAAAYTTMQKGNATEDKRSLYLDSIPNQKMYYYRVRGISSFGEKGPYSNVVSGQAKKMLKYVPFLISQKLISNTEANLTWEFPEEGMGDISGFVLKRADKNEGPYTTVRSNIPPSTRTVNYAPLKSTNYFKITAIGKEQGERDSFAMLVQPIDTIAPIQPIGLEGKINKDGVVSLTWTANTEEDLMGYRVYRANQKNEEIVQLTAAPQPQNTFKDSVNINSLTGNVYYRVAAIDNRYNESPKSKLLTLKKPDLHPPTSPVFTTHTVVDGKVKLTWANSSSNDVAAHFIYRKAQTDTDWKLLLQSTKDNTQNYTDSKVTQGTIYSYTILARDESGLESKPSPPVTLVIPKTKLKNVVKGFYGSTNPEVNNLVLTWRCKETVSSFELYRSVDEKPTTLYKVLPPNSKKFTDSGLTINTTYEYLIRAVFKDGSYSKYSKVSLKY